MTFNIGAAGLNRHYSYHHEMVLWSVPNLNLLWHAVGRIDQRCRGTVHGFFRDGSVVGPEPSMSIAPG